ncbi:MAG: TolC family protein [Saprospiraceae bacterium]|nr:TolC family protein [Saprospiraceae bacterium]
MYQSVLFSNGLSLNSGVLLFNGFRINNTISQSRLNALASKKDINQLERDISLNVATAFLNVIFAKENIIINENQLEQSIAQRELMQKMIRVGNSPENAILIWMLRWHKMNRIWLLQEITLNWQS